MARDEGAPIDFDAELELLDIEQQVWSPSLPHAF